MLQRVNGLWVKHGLFVSMEHVDALIVSVVDILQLPSVVVCSDGKC